jgi:hypothetical protein
MLVAVIFVVAPVYREEGNIAEFCRRVSAAVGQITSEFEIILVEDGGGETVPRIRSKSSPPATLASRA